MALTAINTYKKLQHIFKSAELGKRFSRFAETSLNGVMDASFTIAAEDESEIVVSIQLLDSHGDEISGRHVVDVLLLADANGDAFNANDYTIAAGSDGALVQVVADKVLKCITEADGDLDISLTIAGDKTCYVAVVLPGGGLKISGAVTHSVSDDD